MARHDRPGRSDKQEFSPPLRVEADDRRTTEGVAQVVEERGIPVHEVMVSDLVVAQLSTPVSDAARAMRDNNVGFLPVCQSDGTVAGVLTNRDIVVRVLAEGLPASTPAEEVMTGDEFDDLVICHSGDDIAVVERLMRLNRVSRVLVLGDDERLVGVVSLADVAQFDSECRVGEVIADVAVREVVPH